MLPFYIPTFKAFVLDWYDCCMLISSLSHGLPPGIEDMPLRKFYQLAIGIKRKNEELNKKG